MNDEIQSLKDHLIEGMSRYMTYGGAEDETDPDYDPDFDAGYTQGHVDQVEGILDSYLADVERAEGGDAAILAAVQTAVLALNELNDSADGNLIETDQREQLCEIIGSAAREAGLQTDDDVTEEWREW